MDKKDYNKIPKEGLTRDMFIKSVKHFREVMCSSKYNVKQKDKQFESLTYDYIRCDLEEGDLEIYEATLHEWSMRKPYLIIAEEDVGIEDIKFRLR